MSCGWRASLAALCLWTLSVQAQVTYSGKVTTQARITDVVRVPEEQEVERMKLFVQF
jgi:hypothetical protein